MANPELSIAKPSNSPRVSPVTMAMTERWYHAELPHFCPNDPSMGLPDTNTATAYPPAMTYYGTVNVSGQLQDQYSSSPPAPIDWNFPPPMPETSDLSGSLPARAAPTNYQPAWSPAMGVENGKAYPNPSFNMVVPPSQTGLPFYTVPQTGLIDPTLADDYVSRFKEGVPEPPEPYEPEPITAQPHHLDNSPYCPIDPQLSVTLELSRSPVVKQENGSMDMDLHPYPTGNPRNEDMGKTQSRNAFSNSQSNMGEPISAPSKDQSNPSEIPDLDQSIRELHSKYVDYKGKDMWCRITADFRERFRLNWKPERLRGRLSTFVAQDAGRFYCSKCDKKYKRSPEFSSHMRTHPEAKKHRCSHCSCTFIREEDLKSHYRSYPTGHGNGSGRKRRRSG